MAEDVTATIEALQAEVARLQAENAGLRSENATGEEHRRARGRGAERHGDDPERPDGSAPAQSCA